METLQQFHDESPDRQLFLLLGADSVQDFPTWREPRRILQLAAIVAVNRGDRPACDFTATARQFGDDAIQKILMVQMPGLDVSSRDIRQRVREGRSVRYLVPRAVEVYITQQPMYRNESPG